MKKSILTSNGYNRDDIAYNGNRFLVGNGYFGIRGTLEEYTRSELCAVNLAGVYDRAGGGWRESVNAPDPMYTYVTVNGKKYALPEIEPVSHSQSLDIKNGILSRETVWDTGAGKIRIRSERFACMAEGFKRFACMKYVFSADTECEAELATGINGDVWDINGPHFAELYTAADGETETVTGVTGEKHIKVTVREKVTQDFSAEITANTDGRAAMRLLRFTARPGEEYAVEKTAVTVTSLDGGGIDGFEASYEELRAAHTAAWNRIWDVSEIEIDGDDEAEFALNYSVYHLNCIAPRELYRSEAVSIPARGLSGQVYKGAVFWDTEMFMLDYYAHTEPEIAKTLLRYRVETLDGARKKAAEYGYDGAYYAWESQEGGREGCSDYNVTDVFTKRPMRTHFRDKQYHVSAAVVYGFVKYIRTTSDMSVLSGGGMETMIECARFYRSLLLTRADRRVYELRDVVGPDEYHERVDNNAYTNRMAKLVFDTALELTEAFCKLYPDEAAELDRRYGISELKAMLKDSSENILIKAPEAGRFPVSGIFYFVQSVTDTIFISTSTIFGNASTGIAS